MQTDAEEIRQHLMQTNEEFREFARQHERYDRQVANLENSPVVTGQDEIEEHRLKKLKLHFKDGMEEIVGRYKAQHA